MPGTGDVCIWSDDDPQRREWPIRQAIQLHLNHTLRVDMGQGWAYEGVGHWFTENLLGTHETWYVRPSRYTQPTAARTDRAKAMREPGKSWLRLGLSFSRGKDWPDFNVLLGRDVNAMDGDDLLASYLLARFLIEGRPDVLRTVLTDVGQKTSANVWCAQHLGWTVHELDRRLKRWIREMNARTI